MRTLIVMAALLSILGRLFGGEAGKASYQTADVYDRLRKQILELKAEQLGAPSNEAVLAVLMETGYREAVATLVAVMDGSASLYFSNGGGIIGAGANPGPQAAARKLVAKAAEFQSACARTTVFPLPQEGHTRFYLITPERVLTAEIKEDDLGNNRHRLSPLFHAAHELITQVRLGDENIPDDRVRARRDFHGPE